ncbi:MAG: cysteine--tRNA ligase [bacterium]|nr:cysteine--tRNA ligase [bacterium]
MATVFFNTLTRKKEEFQSLKPGEVGIYTCGQTVYDHAHIGNFRTYMFEDLLRRYLLYKGYKVTQVMNITDVDDKTIKGSNEADVALDDYTAQYIEAFYDDLDTLRIQRAEIYPRATRHIDEMVELIKRLEEKGHTYVSDDGVYFKITSFPRYGRLSGFDISQVKSGARVAVDEYDKEDARDFTLWKFQRPGEPGWESPWGVGRPGWHIECSAMSMKYLGESFDIHTGGVDNIFPHHENEIAQSEAATGKPFVRVFMHSEHLKIDGERMGKSLGNFYTVSDIADEGYNATALRYLLLTTHYRRRLNFTRDGIEAASEAVNRLQAVYRRLKEEYQAPDGAVNGLADDIAKAVRDFDEALDDDLSIAEAMSAVFDLVKVANKAMDDGELSEEGRLTAVAAFDNFDTILDIMQPDEVNLDDEVEELIEKRQQARANKDFALADSIREQLDEMGILLEDTPDGVRWRRK